MGEQRDERGAPLDEHADLEGLRAHQLRDEPGQETPGRVGRPAQGVLTQVCMRCGKEYVFDTAEPPADLTCEKCGNQVFRSFFDVTGPDEVEEDFRVATERDLATDDPATDVTAVDVRDLDSI
ncbi:MAG: hypothetical protein IRZ00_16960 [Gemmatimonadetes bacterium]|nr:hypothetical protein [Gemmatimonadota bacterium]